MTTLRPAWTPGDLAHWLGYVLGDSTDADRAEVSERMSDGPWMAHLEGLIVHDRREEHRPPELKRGRPRPPRPWSDLYGVTVHQTASGALSSDHPKLLGIPAHIVVHRLGDVTLLHPLVLRMPHGHALNGGTIGIEVDCRAYGIDGDPRTFWRTKAEKAEGKRPERLVVAPTREQLDALEKVLDYCAGALAYHGRPMQVWAHRQGHRSRVSDPGDIIAKRCDAHRAARGWPDMRDATRGSGRPWPVEWRAA